MIHLAVPQGFRVEFLRRWERDDVPGAAYAVVMENCGRDRGMLPVMSRDRGIWLAEREELFPSSRLNAFPALGRPLGLALAVVPPGQTRWRLPMPLFVREESCNGSGLPMTVYVSYLLPGMGDKAIKSSFHAATEWLTPLEDDGWCPNFDDDMESCVT